MSVLSRLVSLRRFFDGGEVVDDGVCGPENFFRFQEDWVCDGGGEGGVEGEEECCSGEGGFGCARNIVQG